MATLNRATELPLSTLLADVQKYKYNPAGIHRVALEALATVTNNAVNLVDPTNPAILILEMSAVNAAAAVIESEINTRNMYPILAQTPDQLYRHMSDKDFLNRFAVPTKTYFTFIMNLTDVLSKMVPDPVNPGVKYVTIPRNTQFIVNETTFQMEYPVDIRQYENGVLEVSYDATYLSPLMPITTNIITHTVRTDANSVDVLSFTVDAIQVVVNSTQYILQSSTYFMESINFEHQYYYCRVYYKSNQTNSEWVEIKTTHTDQVYDPYTPTAVLTVLDQQLSVFIPPIYINSGLLDGVVRVDVYTTQGDITLDLSGYKLDAFATRLYAIDDVRDTSPATNAMTGVSYIAYSAELVTGGTDGVDFDALRYEVINNITGDQHLPITNVQLIQKADTLGFDLVKNYDHVTNRIFLATRTLPSPSNPKLITPANITIGTIMLSLDQLYSDHAEDVYVNERKNRFTITPNTLYKSENGVLSICPKIDVDAMLAMSPADRVEVVNSQRYLYSPWYYVFDISQQFFDVRAYYLDAPTLADLNFVAQNPTVALQVSTATYGIIKTPKGYDIVVSVLSDQFYKNLPDTSVNAQLAFKPPGSSDYAYLNGVLSDGKTTNGERIFTFSIETVRKHDSIVDSHQTGFEITKDNHLVVTNFGIYGGNIVDLETPLTHTFTIFYTTSSVNQDYEPSGIDSLIGLGFLPAESIAVTQETLTVHFGTPLDNLWTQARTTLDSLGYETYSGDVPMTYEEDVYKIDPETNSIFSFDENGEIVYNLLYSKGDIVKDEDGNTVYKHRKGDVVLGSDGLPKPLGDLYSVRYIDMMFVDGSYYFATDSAHIAYKKELAETLNTWISDNLADMSDILLEQTAIYYYPKTALGMIEVLIDSENTAFITAEQSLKVTLYVTSTVYTNPLMRQQIEATTIKTLESEINKRTVSTTNITHALRQAYNDSVISFSVDGLGGNANYTVVSLIHDHEQLSINKVLKVQDDSSLIVGEDVAINFINYSTL